MRCRFGELIYDDCDEIDQVCRQDSGGAFCGPAQETMDPPSPDDVDEVIDDANGGGQLVDDEGQSTHRRYQPQIPMVAQSARPKQRGADVLDGEAVITGQTGGVASDEDNVFFDSGASKEANVSSGGCNATGSKTRPRLRGLSSL